MWDQDLSYPPRVLCLLQVNGIIRSQNYKIKNQLAQKGEITKMNTNTFNYSKDYSYFPCGVAEIQYKILIEN